MISVVIPLYNKESQINQTIQSVLRQSFQDFEIVVVDDGSTDNSVSEVKRFNDSRIRIISQTNAGVSAARNRGIAEAKGEFIALLDGDDEWKPDYLATQYALTEKYPECDVFATDYEFRSADGKTTPTIIRRLPFDSEDGILINYFEVATHSHPPLWTSAVMFRKSTIESLGGFPMGIKSGEDLLTWARLACRYKIAYSRKPLAVFIFDETIFNDDQKKRLPESVDIIGNELKKLLQLNNAPGIKEYIAIWHKMRSRIFITKNIRAKAIRECIKSAKYDFNIKIVFFFIMCFLPHKINTILFNRLG